MTSGFLSDSAEGSDSDMGECIYTRSNQGIERVQRAQHHAAGATQVQVI